jgi:hypothetical protein
LLSLTSERLLQNVSRLEGLVEEYKTKLDQQQIRQVGTTMPAPH